MNIQIAKKPFSEIKILAKESVERANIGKAQVVAVFDVSGSMAGMYRRGVVDALVTRVLALGLQLDDNGTIPVYAMDHSCRRVADLTADNLENFAANNLEDLVGGGTEYAPAINMVMSDAQEGDPMLVLFFTDGANSDHAEAAKALIAASKMPIFFQCYGIYEGNNPPSFDFLHKMDELAGRTVDNAGFSPLGLQMVAQTTSNDDGSLYDDMLKEYKSFPAKATQAGCSWEHKPRRKLFGLF